MKVRFKSTKADKSKGLKGSKPHLVLDVQLQHGDVVTMCDTRLQAFTEVSNPHLTYHDLD